MIQGFITAVLPLLVKLLTVWLNKADLDDAKKVWDQIENGLDAERALALINRAARVRAEADANPAGRPDPYLRD